jgi:hypothetical protein
VLRSTEIVLEIEPVSSIDVGELAERASAAFARLGVTARAGKCGSGDVALRLTPDLKSRQVIGRVLSLELDGTIGPCDASAWSEVSLSGSAMRGEGRDPEANLLRNMSAEALEPLIVESLGHVLPF